MSTASAHAHHQADDEDRVILSPEEEAELERAIAESDDDEQAGRLCTADDLLVHDHAERARPYVLTDEEADELEQACVSADEDEKAGRLVPLSDVLASLLGA